MPSSVELQLCISGIAQHLRSFRCATFHYAVSPPRIMAHNTVPYDREDLHRQSERSREAG